MRFVTDVGTSQEEGDFCICAVTVGPSLISYAAQAKVKAWTLDRVQNLEQFKTLRIATVAAESLHIAITEESNL